MNTSVKQHLQKFKSTDLNGFISTDLDGTNNVMHTYTMNDSIPQQWLQCLGKQNEASHWLMSGKQVIQYLHQDQSNQDNHHQSHDLNHGHERSLMSHHQI